MREIDVDVLEDDVEELCRLFVGLVHRVQRDVTIFCVLDSVNVYDDPEYMQGLGVERVLFEVLSLTREAKVQTDVKIWLTSPVATVTIWEGFDEREWFRWLDSRRVISVLTVVSLQRSWGVFLVDEIGLLIRELGLSLQLQYAPFSTPSPPGTNTIH